MGERGVEREKSVTGRRTASGARVPVEEFRAVMYCTCQTVMTGGIFSLRRPLSGLFLVTLCVVLVQSISPVKYSQATPRQKYISVKFPISRRVGRLLRFLGDVHWPQIWDLPKIPPRGRRGIESYKRRNIHRLPRGKSTYRLNFL